MKEPSRTKQELIKELSFLKKKIEKLKKAKTAASKQAKKVMRETESKYRFLAESMADVVFTLDMNLATTYVSPSIERMLGFTQEERMVQKVDQQLTPKSLELVLEALSAELAKEKDKEVDPDRFHVLELEYYSKDGSIKHLATYFRGIRNSEGKLTGFYGSHHDVTARKQAEEALRKSEENYRQLFNNSPTGIYQIDFRTGKFIKANDIMCQHLGCNQEEITTRSPYDFLTNDSKKFFSERLEKMNLGEKVTENPEYEVADINGKRRWLRLNTNNIYDSEGLAGADVVAHDVTDLKRAEFEKESALEVLRESEERYRLLANNIPDIIYSLDGEGKIITINNAAFERYGHTEREVKGKPFLDFVHPEDHENLINSFLKALEEKRKVTTGLKFRIVAENGASYWFELNARARFDSQGQYAGEEGVLRDITDRKKMEEELLRFHKLESLGVLAGGIAHDFNNLMASVHGYIDLALTDLPAGHGTRQRLLKALRSVDQTKDLTSKLITFSRGGAPIKGIFDVVEILRDAVHSATKEQEVKVIFNLMANLWNADVDKLQLRQCFYNMTTNAIEAMPKGGALTVSGENALITASEVPDLSEGSYLKITFADEGIGIPEELLAMIFDPYFTTKEMGAQKGAGLGLAVCYAVLKNHNGHIAVKSKQGKGTSFILYFPAQPEPIKLLNIKQLHEGKNDKKIA